MAAPRRVAAAPAPVAQPVVEGPNFGDLGMYAGDFLLPKGDYCMFFDVRMFKGDKSERAERLGVMVTGYPLDTPTEDHKKEQFYSMGSKAHLSFAPNPTTGKSLVAIPNGPGSTLPPSTNWGMLLKSLYDSAMPPGIFTNDLTSIDGIHVHVEHVDEPAERAGFQSATGEAPPVNQGPRKIAVITEILETGKPWEGTGGLPADGAAAPAKPAAAPARAAVRPIAAPKPAAVQVPAAATNVSADAIQTAAINGVSGILEKNLNGMPWMQLRNSAFSAIKATDGDDMASAVTDTFFGSDEAINGLLGLVGYVKSGLTVKLAG